MGGQVASVANTRVFSAQAEPHITAMVTRVNTAFFNIVVSLSVIKGCLEKLDISFEFKEQRKLEAQHISHMRGF